MSLAAASSLFDHLRKVSAMTWSIGPHPVDDNRECLGKVPPSSGDGKHEAMSRGEEVDHERVPPRQREVDLLELLKSAREKKRYGDFEFVPQLRQVILLDEKVTDADDNQDWEHLSHPVGEEGNASDPADDGKHERRVSTLDRSYRTYADVVKLYIRST